MARKKPPNEIVIVQSGSLAMPEGTPLGLGFLGAARFAAIRRVLESAASAAQAKAHFHGAEAAVADALVHRESARERLRHIDTIREEAAAQIVDGAYIARLERKLKAMELEDAIAERKAARSKNRVDEGRRDLAPPAATSKASVDRLASIIDDLRRIPEVSKAAAEVRAQIVADAGGVDRLTESQRTMLEMVDVVAASALQRKIEDEQD